MVYVLKDTFDDSLICVCDSKETAYNEALDYIYDLSPKEWEAEIEELKDYVNSHYENFYGLIVSIYELPFCTKTNTSSL